MNRPLRLLFMFIFIGGNAFSQSPLWQWVSQAGSGGMEMSHDVCADPVSGNVYACGTFDGNLSGVLGPGIISAGLKDGFVSKYTSSGSLIWSFRIGSLADDEIKSVTCDASGDIYITGYFKGTVDFDPALLSVFNLTASGIGTKEGFLAKYSAAGNFIWAVKFGSAGNEEGNRVYARPSGIFLTGYYESAATFYSTNNISKTTAAMQAQANFFGAKYNSAGEAQWVVSGGSGAADVGFDLVADAAQVYFTGNYASTFFLYDATGVNTGTVIAQTPNKPNVFVCAFSQSGALSWLTNASSGDDDLGFGITADSLKVYIAGGFKNNTINFPYPSPTHTLVNRGGYDIYLACLLKSTGAYQWVSSQAGSSAADELGHAVEKDVNGNIIVAGTFRDTLKLAQFGGQNLYSAGNDDVFISLFNAQGSYLYAVKAGGTNFDVPHGLSSSTTAAIYVSGEYANSCSFGSISLPNLPGKNVFVAKTGCESLSNNTITASQTVCAGSSPQTFTGSLPVGAGSFTYAWQFSYGGTSWTLAPGTNTAQSYSAPTLTAATLYRRVTYGPGSCAYPSNVLTVSVDQLPGPASAGSSQTLCASSASLNANSPAIGSGQWSLLSGQGTITSSFTPQTQVSNLAPGLNVFAWTISNGVCPPSSSTLGITRDLPPDPAVAGSSQTICAAGFTLSANTPGLGSGLWSLLSGTAVIGSPSNPSATITGLTPGNHVFQWTTSNGVCPSSSSTVMISRDDFPSVANAGSSQTLCSASASLSGNIPLVGTGLWSVLSGSSTIVAPAQNSTAVSGLSAGLNLFVWTISNGVCPPSGSTLSISRDLPPDPAVAGSSQTICAASFTLSANTPSLGTGLWSLLSGTAAIGSPSNPSTAVTGIAAGNHVLQWSTSNGVCASSSSTLMISRDDFPSIANAGGDQVICSNAASLNAVQPVTGTGTWLVVSGTGTFSALQNAQTVVSNLSVGPNLFAWVVSNGVCPFSADSILVSRDADPDPALAGADVAVCGFTAQLSANSPLTGNGLWYALSQGPVLTSSLNPLTPVSSLNEGSNLFVWQISNGVCVSTADTVEVFVFAPPSAAVAGADQQICAGVPTLQALAPVKGIGQWLRPSTGSIADSLSPLTVVNGLSPGAHSFVWQVKNGVCPVSADTVNVFFYASPGIAQAGPDLEICGSTATLTALKPLAGTGFWKFLKGQGELIFADSALTEVKHLDQGEQVLVWTIGNGVCPASADTVKISVHAVPDLADAGKDLVICGHETQLLANSPVIGTGRWLLLSGPGTITDEFSPLSRLTGVEARSTLLQWKISNGTCPPSVDEVEVRQDTLEPFVYAGADLETDSYNVRLSAVSSGPGRWEVSEGSAQLADAQDPATEVQALSEGKNVFRWITGEGACKQASDEVVVHVSPFFIPNAISPNGDGYNDRFYITALGNYARVRLQVFNRWGALVYSTDNYQNDWDGKGTGNELLADDTYFYVLEIPGKRNYTGHLLIKRDQ